MKTQKLLFISGMFKTLKFLGICLILTAFFAPAAHAETVYVNPGPVDGNAQNFQFATSDTDFVDIVWTENKTLEYTSGTHLFLLYGQPCVGYAGVLLDAAGKAIPDTELAGKSVCTAGSDLSAGVIELPAATVFSGIRLISGAFNAESAWQWNWDPDDRPVVGQTEASGKQPPVPDAGGPYEGVAGQPVTFDASGSSDPDGTITTHNWDFGDGNSMGGEIIQHTYADSGKYNVTLTVTDNDGLDNSTHTIADIGNFSLRPTADAGGPYEGTVGKAVTFDAGGSTDDGNITQYVWNFGDGSAELTSMVPTTQHFYAAAGTYYVVLTVTDDTGNEDATVTVATITGGNQAPEADAGPPVVGQTGVAVSFDASASSDPDGTIDRYDWDYGDGTTGPDAGPTPSHTYGAPGDYTVSVTVTDDLGAAATDVTSASIDPTNVPPVADANGPYAGLVGEVISFDGSASSDADGTIAKYDWDFGDGNTATDAGPTPTNTYTSAGNFTATLTVTDDDGLTNTSPATVSIALGNQPPTADPNGPYSGVAGAAVSFDGSASSDADGTIARYDWDFGDGNQAIDGGATPSNTYAAAGTYMVVLTVIDDGGLPNSSSTAAAIEATNVPPTADPNGPYTGTAGVAVNFDGSGSSDPDGSVVSWDWDFGDGNMGAGETPSNTYAAAGVYKVTLTVTDDDGTTSSEAFTTAAIDSPNVPPVADADGPYTGKVGVAVDFDGSGSSDADGSIAQYDWDFGDGNQAIDGGPTPSNTYAATGVYDVVLTVTDDSGDTAQSATQAIIGDGVNLPPTADAGGPYTGDEGVAVNFDGSGSSDPDGTIAQYDWDFGDGNDALDGGPTPSNTYASAGLYPVTLTVTDDGGATDTVTTVAAIGTGNLPPVADANGPYSGVIGLPVIFDGSGSSDTDGSIVQYDWDFGDGNNGAGLYASNTYTGAGTFTATLIVTDNDGATDQTTAQVVIGDVTGVNLPPTADANGPYTGLAGVPVTLDGTASDDPDGNIVQYDWAFGDGSIGLDVGPTPDYTYLSGGLYNVILQVTDNGGLVDSDNALALIGELSLPPTADAGGPYNGRVAVDVRFDGLGSDDPDGDIVQYDWDFGDGNDAIDGGPIATNNYAASGTYIVKLTVTDDSGETDTDVTVATIGTGNLPPQANAGDLVSGKVRRDITFDGTGSRDLDGNIVSYAWEFGDGNTGTGPNPTHSYADVGKYFVTLTVTDNDGATSSDVTVADVEKKSGGNNGSNGTCFINTIMGK